MGLSGQIGIHATLTQTPATVPDLGSAPTYPLNYFKNWDLTSGVAANQADECWSDTRTIASATNDDLDLSGTALQNAFGVNLAVVKVKAIMIIASAANTTNLTIGNATATQFLGGFGDAAHTWTLRPGAWFSVGTPDLTGWPCGAGTTDVFRIANASGASATYDIIVVGAKS